MQTRMNQSKTESRRYSVIIPAFNAAHTLTRCLESLCRQMRDDVELLLINDGSTDQTETVCTSFAQKYPQIRAFSKDNGGVSSARNVGLDNARGEYVLFVDADDAVREDYFSVLDDALADRPELLLFSKQLMGSPSCKRKSGKSISCSDRLTCSRILSRCLRNKELNLITTKAFRRDVIEENKLRFDERLDIGEDKVFAMAFSLRVEKIRQIRERLYYLSVEAPDSLSRRKREYLCESVLLEHRLLSELLDASMLPENCKMMYQNAVSYSFYRSAYTVVRELRKYELPASERREKTRIILDRFAAETGYSYRELSCHAISLPIRRKQVRLVDKATGFFAKRGCR